MPQDYVDYDVCGALCLDARPGVLMCHKDQLHGTVTRSPGLLLTDTGFMGMKFFILPSLLFCHRK